MIDYYLKKHCMLTKDKYNPRCKGCIWLDKKINKCVFSINYPKQISINEFKIRIKKVNKEQQDALFNPIQRFIL